MKVFKLCMDLHHPDGPKWVVQDSKGNVFKVDEVMTGGKRTGFTSQTKSDPTGKAGWLLVSANTFTTCQIGVTTTRGVFM